MAARAFPSWSSPLWRCSILQTHRHLAGSDAWELFVATGDRGALFKPDEMSLLELRAAMEGHGTAWSRIVAEAPDPDTLVEEVDDEDGYKRRSPIGVLLAGVLQHGTEHRSQICTALTAFSIIPPHISVVDYGLESGRVAELYPGADETATQKYERFNLPDEGVGARILHSVR